MAESVKKGGDRNVHENTAVRIGAGAGAETADVRAAGTAASEAGYHEADGRQRVESRWNVPTRHGRSEDATSKIRTSSGKDEKKYRRVMRAVARSPVFKRIRKKAGEGRVRPVVWALVAKGIDDPEKIIGLFQRLLDCECSIRYTIGGLLRAIDDISRAGIENPDNLLGLLQLATGQGNSADNVLEILTQIVIRSRELGMNEDDIAGSLETMAGSISSGPKFYQFLRKLRDELIDAGGLPEIRMYSSEELRGVLEALVSTAGNRAEFVLPIFRDFIRAGILERNCVKEMTELYLEHEKDQVLSMFSALLAAGVGQADAAGEIISRLKSMDYHASWAVYCELLKVNIGHLPNSTELIRYGFSLDEKHLPSYLKTLGAVGAAGISDSEKIRSTLEKISTLCGDDVDAGYSSLMKFLELGFTDLDQIFEMMSAAVSAAGKKFRGVLEGLPYLAMNGYTKSEEIRKIVSAFPLECFGAMDYADIIFGQFPEIVATIQRSGGVDPNDFDAILDYFRDNWEDVVRFDLGLEDGGDSILEKAENVLSGIVPRKSFDAYKKLIPELRERGYTDEEILALVKRAGCYNSKYVESIPYIRFAMEGLGKLGLGDLSKSERNDFIITAIQSNAGNLFNSDVHEKYFADPKVTRRWLRELGHHRFQQLLLFMNNSKDHLDGRGLDEIVEMCRAVEKKCGVTFWGRHSIRMFRHLLNPTGDRDVFVVSPRSDHNGSYYSMVANLDVLLDEGYRITMVETDDEKDIYAALERMPKGSIHRREIFGHGTAKTIQLGEGSYSEKTEERYIDYEYDDGRDEWRKYADRLAPGCKDTLHSCGAGRGGKRAKNMVSRFDSWSEGVPGIRTEGPQVITSSSMTRNPKTGEIMTTFDGPTTVIQR